MQRQLKRVCTSSRHCRGCKSSLKGNTLRERPHRCTGQDSSSLRSAGSPSGTGAQQLPGRRVTPSIGCHCSKMHTKVVSTDLRQSDCRTPDALSYRLGRSAQRQRLLHCRYGKSWWPLDIVLRCKCEWLVNRHTLANAWRALTSSAGGRSVTESPTTESRTP